MQSECLQFQEMKFQESVIQILVIVDLEETIWKDNVCTTPTNNEEQAQMN